MQQYTSKGPVSTLPGHVQSVENAMCDDHPDRPAIKRVQGETDSFGCEYHYMCSECFQKFRESSRDHDNIGTCDWCGLHSNLFPRRDVDEGLCGRVYYVCKACIKKDNDRLAEELEDFYDHH